jgi:hypothetical protein
MSSSPAPPKTASSLLGIPEPTGRAIRLAGAFAFAVVMEWMPVTAEAQEDHAASRTIGDATFMLPALADSAFVLTEFGLRQGINYETIPDFPVSSFARYNLSWVEFEERVDLAVRITPWIGLYAQGVASVALGPDAASLLFEGGGLDFGGKGGVVFRLYRNDRIRSQVAVRAYAGGDGGRTLDLPDFLEAVAVRAANGAAGAVQNSATPQQLAGQFENQALSLADTNFSNIVFYRTSTVRIGGSIHYAQGLVGPLTLQVAAIVEQSWSSEKPYSSSLNGFENLSTTDTAVTFDAVLSASLSRWSIPLGLSAEYAGVTAEASVDGVNANGSTTTQYVGGGVWYTGRRGVEIGVLAFTQRSLRPIDGFDTTSSSGKPSGYSGAFIFRALW